MFSPKKLFYFKAYVDSMLVKNTLIIILEPKYDMEKQHQKGKS